LNSSELPRISIESIGEFQTSENFSPDLLDSADKQPVNFRQVFSRLAANLILLLLRLDNGEQDFWLGALPQKQTIINRALCQFTCAEQ